MMNQQLEQLARELALESADNERLRLAFAYACGARVRHMLEEPRVVACLEGLERVVRGAGDAAELTELAVEAAKLANQHPGSNSLDGCGHAAVSASYAVAKALAGKALQAAEYAAYARVYYQGGAGAVADLHAGSIKRS